MVAPRFGAKLFDGVPEMAEMLSCGVKRFMVDATLLSTLEADKRGYLSLVLQHCGDGVGCIIAYTRLKDVVGHLFANWIVQK